MKNKTRNAWLGFTVIALMVAASAAKATTPGFLTPDFRGDANSEYGYWEIFSSGTGPNSADQAGSTTSAILSQSTTDGLLLLGGGDRIYSFAAPLAFTLTDSVSFDLGTVVIQTHTLTGSTPLDYSSALLSYDVGAGVQTIAPIISGGLDSASDGDSWLWQWDLTGLGITSYAISFDSTGSSTSFDSLTSDISDHFVPMAVPEPSIFALAGVGLTLLGAMARRMKSNA